MKTGGFLTIVSLAILLTASAAVSGTTADESEKKPDENGFASKPIVPPWRARSAAWSDSLDAYLYLGEIIVTGDRWREGHHARTEVVASEDIAAQPGYSAGEVLKSVPGVGVSSGRKDESSITIRGFDSRRVSIMVDGRPVNLPYYGTFNISSMSLDKLEKIMVVRGPTSVTYGPNVMGGVVNFVTARGKDHPGTRFRFLAGNHDTGEALLTHGRILGDWDIYVSFRGGGSDGSVMPRSFKPIGYMGMEDGGFRDNSDYTEYDLFGKVGYSAGARTDLAFSCGYHTIEKGVPAAVDEERYWRFTDWVRTFADVTMRRQIRPHTYLEAKAYGDVFINTLVDYEDASYDPAAVFYNSTHRNWDVGGIASLEHQWSTRLHGTYGLNLREDQIKKRMNPEEPWLYHHQVTGSLSAEHHGRITDNLWGSCGISDNFMIHNHMKDVDQIPGFSAGMTLELESIWSLSASTGQGSRFPTLSQLWGDRSGNRDLRPEITRRYEFGVNARPAGGFQGELTFFWNDLRDLIDRDAARAGKYYNIQTAESRGFELAGRKPLFEWLDFQASYTYTGTKNRHTGDPLDLIPENKLDGRLIGYSAGRDTRWVLVITHVGERFDSESLTSHQTLGAYTTGDCLVSTHLSRHLSLTLEILNISDLDYEEETMYPAPGRTVLAAATVDF